MSAVKVEYINPFVSSCIQTFASVIGVTCRRTGIYVKKPEQTLMAGDITVVVSMFGGLRGTVALTFPRKLAIVLISTMLGDDTIDDISDEVKDGIGEIGNMVAGQAKSQIAQAYNKEASISIPTLVTGLKHHLQHNKGIQCIGCIFEVDGMKFALETAVAEE